MLRKKSLVMLIAVLVFSICLTMAFSITASADYFGGSADTPSYDVAIKGMGYFPVSESPWAGNAPQHTWWQQSPASDAPSDASQPTEQEPGQEPVEDADDDEGESPVQPVSEEPTMEPAEQNVQESAAKQESDNTYANLFSGSYLVTISDSNGNSVDVTGGTQTVLSDVLKNLGYEIGEDTVIEVDLDSVDTNVVNVTVDDNGEYILTDNGRFDRAAQNLIVYVNGVAVELELADPTPVKSEDLQKAIENAGEDGLRLFDNVKLVDDVSITLTEGVYNLYLSGKTLSAASGAENAMFVITEGVTLNVYGGVFEDSTCFIGGIESSATLFDIQGGTLNIISGSYTSAEDVITMEDGSITIEDGTFTSTGDSRSVINSTDGELTINGGTFTSTGEIGKVIKSTDGELTINGGTFTFNGKNSSLINSSDCELTINGGTFTSTGKYTFLIFSTGGELTINGGTFTSDYTTVYANGVLTINGGYIESTDESKQAVVARGSTTVNGGTFKGGTALGANDSLVINGGEFYGTSTALSIDYSDAVINGGSFEGKTAIFAMNSSLIINYAEAKGSSSALSANKAVVNVLDGEFDGSITAKNGGVINLAGGKYNASNTADYVAGNYEASAIVDDTFTVQVVPVDGKDLNVLALDSSNKAAGYETASKALEADRYNLILTDDLADNFAIRENRTATLDLNGKVLTGSSKTSVISVSPNASLTVKDSYNPTEHYFTYNSSGAWSYVASPDPEKVKTAVTVDGITSETENGVYVKVLSGVITGSVQDYGAGICIYSAEVTMESGSIVGCYADEKGGAVEALTCSRFIMTGGSIVGNGAFESGGGINVENDASASLKGGLIAYNTANNGGGMYVAGSADIAGSAVITDNTALNLGGGVYAGSSNITIGGAANITGNTLSSGSANNVSILTVFGTATPTGYTITISDDFTGEIGISVNSDVSTGNPVDVVGSYTGSYTGTVTPDNDEFYLYELNNQGNRTLKLGVETAQMNGKTYGSVSDALIEAGTTPSTITLIANSVENITIAAGQTITLDLNDKVLKASNKSANNNSVITVEKGAALTVTDSAAVKTAKYFTSDETGLYSYTEAQTALSVTGGVITGGSGTWISSDSKSFGGGIYVKAGGSLTVDGGNIVGNSADKGAGIYAKGTSKDNASVTVNGGKVVGNRAAFGGAGIFIGNYAGLTMTDGEISSNSAYNSSEDTTGGGIYISGKNAKLNITGGTVSKNSATRSGGIRIDYSTDNSISNATVSGNTAGYGGGIYLAHGANAVLTNVNVKENTSSNKSFGAGGIFLDNASATVIGGEITGNRTNDTNGAGGIRVQDSKLTVGGNVKVTGNYAGSNERNVFLKDGNTIAVSTTSPLTDGAGIGVFTEKNPSTGVNKSIVDASSVDNTRFFRSDKQSYAIGGEADNSLFLSVDYAAYDNDGQKYVTLQDAFDGAADKAQLTLVKNVIENLVFDQDKEVSLDLNEHSITAVNSGVALTITDGKLTIDDSSWEFSDISSVDNNAIEVTGGELILNNLDVYAGRNIYAAVYVNGGKVTLNSVEADAYYGLYVANGSAEVYDSYIYGRNSTDDATDGYGVIVYSDGEVTIESSEIYSAYVGINNQYGKVKVTDSLVHSENDGSSASGIFSYGGEVTLTDVLVYGSNSGIIAGRDSLVTVTGGKVIGEGEYGIHSAEGTVKLFEVKSVEGPTAVKAADSKLTAYKTKFNGEDFGIVADESSADKSFTWLIDCEVNAEDDDAIAVSGGELFIKGGTVTSNDENGITGYNADITVIDAEVSGIEYGMELEDCSVYIADSYVYGDSDDGFYADNSEITIKDSEIISDEEDGICVNKCDIAVINSKITGCEYGIDIRNGSRLTVTGSRVIGEGDNGINAYNSTVNVIGSYVYGDWDGIHAENSSVINVSGSTVTGDCDGISAYDSKTFVTDSIITALDGSGLNINGGSATVSGEFTRITGDNAVLSDDDANVELKSGYYNGHLAVDNFGGITVSGGFYSEDPTLFLADGYSAYENEYGAERGTFPYRVGVAQDKPAPGSYRTSGSSDAVVSTDDEGLTADCTINGDTAVITVKDAEGKQAAPKNVNILLPAELKSQGVKTVEIALTDNLTLVLDLDSVMNGEEAPVITIDFVDGIVTVSCNGNVIFTADLSDIAETVARVVYDGTSLKAFDAQGNVIKEFEI